VITAVDLFCGVGGLTHGLAHGGIKVVAGVDVDANCKYPYEANNQSRFMLRDVRAIEGVELQSLWCRRRSCSLLAGCAPCQPFSTYSRKGRKNRNDEKWELVKEFGRLIHESQPDLVTMENVPQLRDHAVFAEFVDAMEGYHVWHRIVECSNYGVPQTRKRLVLLASRLGPIALEPPSMNEQKTPSVRDAIGHLRPLAAGECDPRDGLHAACKLSALNLQRIKASKPGGSWRDWKPSLVAKCHQRKSGETYPSVYGRMEWNEPSPTITTQCFGYGNGRFGHPEQHRAITLREAAVLQTFPSSYKFLAKGDKVCFSVMGRLIGNAVPVRLAHAVAKCLTKHVAAYR
jgi:DNA (cytosine-5)-methyltransferase 1